MIECCEPATKIRTNLPCPFKVGVHGNREQVIALYRADLWRRIRAGEVSLEELAAIASCWYACWCSPLPCHGTVLARAAAWASDKLTEQADGRWKPRTLQANSRIVRKDILPAFGDLTVDAITVEQVRDWFAAMSDRPGLANRAMPVLSMMMRMAELWGYRAHNSNPCRNTRRYRMKPMERFLTADEMARLNAVLTRDEFWCPNVVAIVRLLMLTGCRFSEIASLEWDWIKDKRIRLPDSKSGPRTVWLSSAAHAVIDAIPRYSADCPYLFPGRPPTRPIDTIQRQWDRIRDEAGLPGLRIHDLRHSWASVAAMNGVDMVTVAKLLGHSLVETTERYVHLSDQSVADAADRVSGRISAALAGRGAEREGESDHAHR